VRKKKITGAFLSSHAAIHVDASKLGATSAKIDALACHINKKDISERDIK
jgi:hypothetical protein